MLANQRLMKEKKPKRRSKSLAMVSYLDAEDIPRLIPLTLQFYSVGDQCVYTVLLSPWSTAWLAAKTEYTLLLPVWLLVQQSLLIPGAAGLFFSTFALVFAAEWGDKSFLATIALAAASSPTGEPYISITRISLAALLKLVAVQSAKRKIRKAAAICKACDFNKGRWYIVKQPPWPFSSFLFLLWLHELEGCGNQVMQAHCY